MTYSYVSHDSFIYTVWHDSFIYTVWHDYFECMRVSFTCVTWLIHMWVMTHSYIRYDTTHSYIRCGTTILNVWELHSHVWHDLFIYESWLIHIYGMTQLYLMYESFIHMRDMHDLFIYESWLIHIWDLNHPQIRMSYVMPSVCWLHKYESYMRHESSTHMIELCHAKCVLTTHIEYVMWRGSPGFVKLVTDKWVTSNTRTSHTTHTHTHTHAHTPPQSLGRWEAEYSLQ